MVIHTIVKRWLYFICIFKKINNYGINWNCHSNTLNYSSIENQLLEEIYFNEC